jgi:prepilin-type N-terminal cleavage/methylation domain-containing protein
MRKMIRKNNQGFTLVEVILATTILGFLGMSLSILFSAGAESFSLVKSRNELMENSRAGLNRMVNEIMYIESDDISLKLPASFTFLDAEGSAVNYSIGSYSGITAVMRNNDILIPNAESIYFTYYDEEGNIAINVADVRRIKISLVVNAEDSQGNITMSASVYPKAFMFAGFQ